MTAFNHIHSDSASGTVGGTVLTVIYHINGTDIVKTAVLAFVGAVVSFYATKFCRWVWRKIKSKFYK